MSAKYRTHDGKFYTIQLFYEKWREYAQQFRIITPPFTLDDEREGYISMARHYVESRDPTGYTTAMELLGSYKHWEILNKCSWFTPYRQLWDRELDANLKSEAMAKMREIAETGEGATKLTAAKYLANLEYKKKPAEKGVGRPTREAVDGALKREVADTKAVEEDMKRISG